MTHDVAPNSKAFWRRREITGMVTMPKNKQVHSQGAERKRRLCCAVPASKRQCRNLSTNSESSKSPFMSSDSDSLVFVAETFYNRRGKKSPPSYSHLKPVTSGVSSLSSSNCSSTANSFSSGRKLRSDSTKRQPLKTSHVALSPLKSPCSNISSTKSSGTAAVVIRRFPTSFPPKLPSSCSSENSPKLSCVTHCREQITDVLSRSPYSGTVVETSSTRAVVIRQKKPASHAMKPSARFTSPKSNSELITDCDLTTSSLSSSNCSSTANSFSSGRKLRSDSTKRQPLETSPRVALSPLKSPCSNISSTKSSGAAAVVIRRFPRSFPPKLPSSCSSENSPKLSCVTHCREQITDVLSRSPYSGTVAETSSTHALKPSARFTSPKPNSELITDCDLTTSSGRRFFKHKSPASASKSVGGVIIGKGFKLKFTRPTFSKVDNRKSPVICTSKVKSTRRAFPSNAHKETRKKKNPAPQTKKCSIVKKENFLKTVIVPSYPTHKHSSGEINDTQSDAAENDNESIASGSCDLFSSDTQSVTSSLSLVGDSQSVTSGMFWTGNSQSPVESLKSSLSPDSQNKFQGKFYSIFTKKRHAQSKHMAELRHTPCHDYFVNCKLEHNLCPGPGNISPRGLRKKILCCNKDDPSQLVLDAGQKNLGVIQCQVCCMVYSTGDPIDETTHAKFHASTLQALKFSGWKKERVVQEFPDDGGRVIVVLPEDKSFMVKKVEEVNHVMVQELGFPDQAFTFRSTFKAFLYVSSEKRIEGCCIAEPIREGYRVLPNTDILLTPDSQRPWFCSTRPEPASLGIGRLWVYGPSRKNGIATRLVECVRQWFEYGVMIDKAKVAFSDPTADGRKFATKYIGTPMFLVYRYIP